MRATVRAWVHGHLETYTEDVELDSLQRTVATLAQAVYRRYMGTYFRTGGVGSCPSAKSSNFAPLVLPRDASTLPEVCRMPSFARLVSWLGIPNQEADTARRLSAPSPSLSIVVCFPPGHDPQCSAATDSAPAG